MTPAPMPHPDAIRAKLESLDREREELEALITTPGWRRFEAELATRYGDEAFRATIEGVANGTAKSDAAPSIIGQQVLQQLAVAKHVKTLLQWPRERIAAIDAERKGLRALGAPGFHRVGR